MTYATVADIRRANAERGHHFFEPGAMRFFGSRVGRRVYGGRFFITSEQREPETERRYSVRMARPNGEIEEVSAFMRYASRADAERHIREMLHALDTGAEGRIFTIRARARKLAEGRRVGDPHDAAEMLSVYGEPLLMAALVREEERANRDDYGAKLALWRELKARCPWPESENA